MRAYGDGCGGVVAPTYGAASPVIETARCGGDYINWEIRILEVVSPRCYMFCCHLSAANQSLFLEMGYIFGSGDGWPLFGIEKSDNV